MDTRAPFASVQETAATASTTPAPVATVKPTAAATSDVAEAMKENNGITTSTTANTAGAIARPWSANQRRQHEGHNIFGANPTPDSSPAAHVPEQLKPVAEEECAPQPPSQISIAPKDLTLPELRMACRERGLNPGGGKPSLVERLTMAIDAGACASLGAKAEAASAGARIGAGAAPKDTPATEQLQQQQQRHVPAKRSSPDAGVNVSRKAARVAAHGHDIFAAPEEKPAAAPWAPRADAFLTDFLNSPKKGAGGGDRMHNVSEAKLRDLGVGRDIFSDGTGGVPLNP